MWKLPGPHYVIRTSTHTHTHTQITISARCFIIRGCHTPFYQQPFVERKYASNTESYKKHTVTSFPIDGEKKTLIDASLLTYDEIDWMS